MRAARRPPRPRLATTPFVRLKPSHPQPPATRPDRRDFGPATTELEAYSGTLSPEPPNSAGKSFSLGRPSRMGSTVSA